MKTRDEICEDWTDVEEIKTKDISYAHEIPVETGEATVDNYRKLSTAIVRQACKDYILAAGAARPDTAKIKAFEHFFSSDWCDFLISAGGALDINLDGSTIMKALNKKVETKKQRKNARLHKLAQAHDNQTTKNNERIDENEERDNF